MQSWIFLVIIAHSIWSICVIIDKIVISKGHIKNPVVYIMVNAVMNLLLVFVVPFIHIEWMGWFNTLLAISYGMILCVAVILFYKAVEYDEISRLKMMDQCSPVFVLFLSFLFLGEVLSGKYLIGFLFLISAGLLASYHGMGGKFKLSKAYLLVISSSFIGAFGSIMIKHIYTSTHVWNAFFWTRLGQLFFVIFLLKASLRKESIATFKSMSKGGKKLLGFKMVIDFCAFIIGGFAIQMGPISLLTALSVSIAPLIVFLFATLLTIYYPDVIKEDLSRKNVMFKLAAMLLIVIGIFFITVD